MKENKNEPFGQVIHSYTRAQALADGVLVEVPKDIREEAGIKYHTALTAAVWHEYVTPPGNLEYYGQSIQGRLWDLLWMFRNAALRTKGQNMRFTVLFQMRPEREPEEVTLTSHIGPGDEGGPVITIMLEHED
jgi:hypothetical protein